MFNIEPGLITGVEANLNLKEGAQPRFCRPCSVPYASKERVSQELDRLVETGVLHKVGYAEWAAPIVLVLKKDGSICICRDYKVTVNPALCVDQYPLPKPADLMTSLTSGRKCTQLNLCSAYQQVELDAKSAKQ